MLCYVMLCYVMLCYVMLCYVMLCYVMLCYVMLCYVMLCYVMLCYVMLCYVMLCNVMLCYVMLCYVMLCYVMLCYVMLLLLCYWHCYCSLLCTPVAPAWADFQSPLRPRGQSDCNGKRPLSSVLIIPKPTVRGAVPSVSPGRGLLIPHGYLHPGKRRASGVKSPSMIAGASLWFVVHGWSSPWSIAID